MALAQDTLERPLPSPYRRSLVWWVCQMLMRPVFVFWLRYRARGVGKIPARGGALLVINHESSLDPLMAGLPLSRPVSFLARDSLFRIPGLGWLLRQTYVMPISREAASTASIKSAVQRMQHGFLVGIFPEGTRGTGEELGEIKPGFIALLRRARVPVYPVGIAGTGAAYPRGAWFIRPRRVRVVFGDPLSCEELEPLTQHGHEAELISEVRERMLACRAEADRWLRGGSS